MPTLTRRGFLGTASAAVLPWMVPITGQGADNAPVVVIGGGFGGATCAKYLRRLEPSLQVTLVERNRSYATCPFSNLVLGGLRDMSAITHDYEGLKGQGIEVIHNDATGVDPVKRRVDLEGGRTLQYERLIVAPGIDLRWDAVEGYDQAASELLPHAWKAGPQTTLLRQQIEAMNDGGSMIIAAPGNPYRCPPGPYERASLIAHYFGHHKPRSKILILDAKDKFSKQGLFTQGWEQLYPGMIEWVAGSEGGLVDSVDPGSRTLYTEAGFTEHSADVVNFIPPQQAAAIAHRADLVDETGWCPIDQLTFESSRQPGIHVLGDAAIAGAMPKSGFSANSQAKVCAAAVVTSLAGESLPQPSYANTCYSLVGPDYGISVSGVYRLIDGKIGGVESAGGLSPIDAGADVRAKEADYASGWYASIVMDSFG